MPSRTSRQRIRHYASEDVLGEFYRAVASGDPSSVVRVHIPRSEVFYTRLAYYNATGNWETLDRMERSMYLEGMLKRHDVLDPDRPRDWEKEFKVDYERDYERGRESQDS